MRLLVALLCLLLLSGCAHKPGSGSIADSATTYAVLADGGSELNPIIGWSGDPAITALTALGVKQGGKYGLTSLGVEHCQAHRYVETGGWLGAGWNLAILSGAGPPGAIAAGILTATTYYRITDPAAERGFSCREAP